MNKIKLGKLGEDCAERFLISQSHHPLERNYYCRFGEIDLITFDYPNRQIVFTEVKTRTNIEFGLPQEALTARKKSKILKTALHFLSLKYAHSLISWRIDLIAVQLNEKNCLKEIEHFKNILNG